MPSMPMYHLGDIILLVNLTPISIGFDSSDLEKEQITVAKNKLTSTGSNFSDITANDYVEASSDYKELLTKAGWEIKSVQYPKMLGEGGTVYHPGDTFDEISGADATYITIEAVTPAMPETWVLNKLGTSTLGNDTFNVSFESNNTTYSKIVCDRFETEALYYDSTMAWQTGEWRNEAYRTIVFDSHVTDTSLLTWLQANGTKQETDTSKKLTKLRYKVSDFCQLMDKSKYPATRVVAGITFTNNGDGSFTMTGTKTGNAQLEICVADIKKGHKYLGTTGTDTFYMWFFKSDGSSIYGDFIRSPFYTATETDTDIRFFIKTDSTDEVNVTAYPQLFDLTEMYGAGNEPTTLAEFRQDFPNDLYPYSLQWYSINKTRYMSNKFGNSVLTDNIGVYHRDAQKFFYITGFSGSNLYKRVAGNVIPKMGLLDYKVVSNNDLYGYISNDKTVSLGYPGMFDNFIMVRDLSFNGDTEKFKQFIIGNNVWFELETPAQGGYLPIHKGVKL